jgi:Short C-terminal domain
VSKNPWVAKLEADPCYKRLDGRAVRLFNKQNADPAETPLTSTKGVRRPGLHQYGRKGYLLITTHGLHWLGLRGGHEFFGWIRIAAPQGRGTKSLIYLPGGGHFATRYISGKRVRQFVSFNDVALRANLWSEPTAASSTGAKPLADGITDQITQLATLRDQGHITIDEYEKKKTELLARL